MVTDERIEEIQVELAQARDEAREEVEWRRNSLKHGQHPASMRRDIQFELEAWDARYRALAGAVAALDIFYVLQ